MSAQTGVSGVFCASHKDPTTGLLHGHSWEVTAWTDATPHRDARVLQERLKGVLRVWDHTVLPEELGSGEAIAAAVASLLGDCAEVVVSRPLERIHARWRP